MAAGRFFIGSIFLRKTLISGGINFHPRAEKGRVERGLGRGTFFSTPARYDLRRALLGRIYIFLLFI